jgi:hypothetical protein
MGCCPCSLGLRHQPPPIDLAGDGGGDQGGAAFTKKLLRFFCLRNQSVK